MDLYLDMAINDTLCMHLFASFIKRRPSHVMVVKNHKEHFDLKGNFQFLADFVALYNIGPCLDRRL